LSSCLLSENIKNKIYKTIILPVVLYRCETWSLTLRDHRLRVFERRVLRGISGPKTDEMTGGWKKLHKEEFQEFVLFTNRVIKTRRMRWAGHVVCMGDM
jgi:hypothetical protein